MCGCSELKIDNLKNVCLNKGLHHKRNISQEISSEKCLCKILKKLIQVNFLSAYTYQSTRN